MCDKTQFIIHESDASLVEKAAKVWYSCTTPTQRNTAYNYIARVRKEFNKRYSGLRPEYLKYLQLELYLKTYGGKANE